MLPGVKLTVLDKAEPSLRERFQIDSALREHFGLKPLPLRSGILDPDDRPLIGTELISQ